MEAFSKFSINYGSISRPMFYEKWAFDPTLLIGEGSSYV
jgi:hypothetical protein